MTLLRSLSFFCLLGFSILSEREFPQPRRSRRIYSVYATRNRAPTYITKYALNHCIGLVGVLTPFCDLHEILDLDMGLGPHLNVFVIVPKFDLGKVIQANPSVHFTGFMQISVNFALSSALI